ncbi:MAG: hypothetical protein H6531_00385 [Actinobacteria bacterium]|nr:hypothetical protein [Thermoleophilia bacterium]MCB9010273.1 hypothetical protein [Actinomycetota bacterium]
MLTTFDPDKGPLFKGEFLDVAVLDPAIPGHVPNLVLDPRRDYRISVKWRIYGSDVPLYLAALSSEWRVNAYAESMGPGPEVRVATDTINVSAGTNDATVPFGKVWEHRITVPAGVLPEDGPNSSGLYKLVVTTFLNSTIGQPGFDIAGFAEGPIVRVENPV